MIRKLNPLNTNESYEAQTFKICLLDKQVQLLENIEGFKKVSHGMSITCKIHSRHMVARDIFGDLIFLGASCFQKGQVLVPLVYFVSKEILGQNIDEPKNNPDLYRVVPFIGNFQCDEDDPAGGRTESEGTKEDSR